MSRNLVIFGHKQHGKDTACLYVQKHFGLSFISSSFFACVEFLYKEMKEVHGYKSIQECYDDRNNHRKYWYEAIRDYNTPNKTRLGTALFEDHPIYCGIRDLEEFEALKAAGLIGLAIFIDASGRKEEESLDSMKLNREHGDIVITNNGTEEELYIKLDKLFIQMGYTKTTA